MLTYVPTTDREKLFQDTCLLIFLSSDLHGFSSLPYTVSYICFSLFLSVCVPHSLSHFRSNYISHSCTIHKQTASKWCIVHLLVYYYLLLYCSIKANIRPDRFQEASHCVYVDNVIHSRNRLTCYW